MPFFSVNGLNVSPFTLKKGTGAPENYVFQQKLIKKTSPCHDSVCIYIYIYIHLIELHQQD